MFSIKCLRLVKALHDLPIAYRIDSDNYGYDCWDNNVGECPSWFYGICRYEERGAPFPCWGCTRSH